MFAFLFPCVGSIAARDTPSEPVSTQGDDGEPDSLKELVPRRNESDMARWSVPIGDGRQPEPIGLFLYDWTVSR